MGKITRHVAIDINQVTGTVTLTDVKMASVVFKNSDGDTVLFTKEPMVSITLLNAAVVPPFKVKASKTGNLFSGFILGFQTPQTIDIDWTATERA